MPNSETKGVGMKILAINGSYRRDGITDQTIDAIFGTAMERGAEVEQIYLTEKNIEFCINCRKCTIDNPEDIHGKCIFNDDNGAIYDIRASTRESDLLSGRVVLIQPS